MVERRRGVSKAKIDLYVHKAEHRKGGIYSEQRFREKVAEYKEFLLSDGATAEQIAEFERRVENAPFVLGGFIKVSND